MARRQRCSLSSLTSASAIRGPPSVTRSAPFWEGDSPRSLPLPSTPSLHRRRPLPRIWPSCARCLWRVPRHWDGDVTLSRARARPSAPFGGSDVKSPRLDCVGLDCVADSNCVERRERNDHLATRSAANRHRHNARQIGWRHRCARYTFLQGYSLREAASRTAALEGARRGGLMVRSSGCNLLRWEGTSAGGGGREGGRRE